MNFLVQLAILVVTTLIAYALAPKPPKPKPPSLDDFEVPTAEAGRAVPVVFGEVTVTGPNCVWYGDLEVETETEDGVKRRFYYLGMHFVVCYGPVDSLSKILYGNKVAWGEGSSAWGIIQESPITSSQEIAIFASNLHGGEDREGGLAGYFDVLFGDSTQGANAYLISQLGSPQPAYRGVLSVIGKHAYVGTSQYVKPFAFAVKRILSGWYNDSPWYPEKANVVGDTTTASYDIYAAGGEGGTALDYWWKLDTDFSAGNEANNGVGGTAVLEMVNPSGGTFNTTPVTLNTEDEGAFYSDGASIRWLTCETILVDGTEPFTAGGWFNVPSISGGSLLFRSNLGGEQGFYRGIDVLHGQGTDYLTIVIGTNSSTDGKFFYRLTSPAGSFPISSNNFVALYVEPVGLTMLPALTLYINGVERFLTYSSGTGDTVAWPTTPSNPSGYVGIGYGAIDTYGGSMSGTYDEVFFHWGELSAVAINELYRRGTGGASTANDMNPAHIIYEAITNPDWGMGYPASVIDDTNFRAAADTFYNEGMGLSLQWLRQETVEDFIQIILDHCAAVLTVDQSTGKFQLKTLRADYTVGSLPEFDETNIVAVEEFERAGYGELVGEVTAVYREKSSNTDQGVTVHNLAVIQSQSGTTSETSQYPGISRYSLAARVAERDLDSKSVPLARGKIRVNREAWDLTPADVFKLSWAKLGLTSVVCRVAEIDYGTLTDGAITITFVEDVFGLPSSSYAAQQSTLWIEQIATESENAEFRLDEAGDDRMTENQIDRYTEGT